MNPVDYHPLEIALDDWRVGRITSDALTYHIEDYIRRVIDAVAQEAEDPRLREGDDERDIRGY